MERFAALPQVAQLHKQLEAPQARARVEGLSGSQMAFVLAGLLRAAKKETLHLCIAEGKPEAAYLFNDLTGLVGESQAHFFPDSFKRPAHFDDLNATQVLQRSELVNKVTAPRRKVLDGDDWAHRSTVIVTYPEALFEQVVSPEILAQNRIEIVKNERLDLDFVMHVLIEYGFERADFVYEPGQFSVRGGIVDLFSYGNDLPYRIEMLDDDVESIRTFDPLTQASVQTVEAVRIVPNLNTRFERSQKVSLFHILPQDSVVWVKDTQFVLERLQHCAEKVETYAAKLSTYDEVQLREILRDRAFVRPPEVIEDIEALRMVAY